MLEHFNIKVRLSKAGQSTAVFKSAHFSSYMSWLFAHAVLYCKALHSTALSKRTNATAEINFNILKNITITAKKAERLLHQSAPRIDEYVLMQSTLSERKQQFARAIISKSMEGERRSLVLLSQPF